MQNLDAGPERVRAEVNGRVIGPDDGDYDRARGIFYGGFDRRPGPRCRHRRRWPGGQYEVFDIVGKAVASKPPG